MRSVKAIEIVNCHAEGEVGDVIVGGVAPPTGATLWEQSRFIARDGALRAFVLNEPRGGVFRHVNLVVPLEVEGVGTITVDTAFGGDSFVLADAAALGFAMAPDEARDIAVLGRRVVAAANEQIGFTHPTLPDWRHYSFAFVTGPLERI